MLWGYVRGLDFLFTELYNIFDNIPTAIVLILISYVASPSIWTMILGMSIKGWIEMARFIRNQILIIRDRDYNVASRCIGTPTVRIVLRNLLPYLVSVIMLRMALTIPEAIGNEVFITYIGLGLSVETPSLGNLVNDGRKVMMQAGLRYQLLYPTLILSFVTIAFYLIGNAFSDAADRRTICSKEGVSWNTTSSFSPQKMSTSSSTCVEKCCTPSVASILTSIRERCLPS